MWLVYNECVVDATIVVCKGVEEVRDGPDVARVLVFANKSEMHLGASSSLKAVGTDKGLGLGVRRGVLGEDAHK